MTRKNFAFLTLAVILMGALAYFAMGTQAISVSPDTVAPAAGDATAPVADTNVPAAAEPAPATAEAAAPAAAGDVKIDVAAAMEERSEGDPNAPVHMHEYASLSCPHCGAFMKETFPKIDENYIKTGKVYYTFHDFPLNGAALDGAMVARCLPKEQYFPFITLLFQTQADWAFTEDPRRGLKQSAKLAGSTDALVDACLANDELRNAIAKQLEADTKEKKIESTPTFFINDGDPLKGAYDYKVYADEIDAQLAKAKK
jgi:protein-disulfide isomerase